MQIDCARREGAGRSETMRKPDSQSRRRFLAARSPGGRRPAGAGLGPRARRRPDPARARPFPTGSRAGEVGAAPGRRVERDRPAGPNAGRVRHHASASRTPGASSGRPRCPRAGYTAKVVLTGLPAGQDVFYRVTFLDLGDLKTTSAPVDRPLPDGAGGRPRRDVRVVGRHGRPGLGHQSEWGGMKIYEVMRGLEPDFFVHSGDMIYADGPLKAEVDLPGRRRRGRTS